MQKSMGSSKRILPPYIVPIQLKILIHVGMATRKVEIAKKVLPTEVIPTENMWCAQTLTLIRPIIAVAPTMMGYPKMGLREKTGMISERQGKARIIRMYTSGCPKIQKKCCQITAEPPACVSKKCPAG